MLSARECGRGGARSHAAIIGCLHLPLIPSCPPTSSSNDPSLTLHEFESRTQIMCAILKEIFLKVFKEFKFPAWF